MSNFYNLAKMSVSGTPGTGNITLGSAVTGFLTFAQAGVQDGDYVTYAIQDGANCEIGRGFYTASGTVLSRDSVLRSSGAGNNTKISATSSATVFICAAAEDMPATGDVQPTLATTARDGWVMCNDGTIGSAASGASSLAHAKAKALYLLLWTNVSDTYAPVTGGRGASASADFAANKPIALTKMLGRALAAAGAGAGLTSRALGQTVGAETHTLTVIEIPAHSHDLNNVDGSATNGTAVPAGSPSPGGSKFTTTSAGGGGAHNNMQPTAFVNFMVKL